MYIYIYVTNQQDEFRFVWKWDIYTKKEYTDIPLIASHFNRENDDRPSKFGVQ